MITKILQMQTVLILVKNLTEHQMKTMENIYSNVTAEIHIVTTKESCRKFFTLIQCDNYLLYLNIYLKIRNRTFQ